MDEINDYIIAIDPEHNTIELNFEILSENDIKDLLEALKDEVEYAKDYLNPFLEAQKTGKKTVSTNWGQLDVENVVKEQKELLDGYNKAIENINQYYQSSNCQIIKISTTETEMDKIKEKCFFIFEEK